MKLGIVIILILISLGIILYFVISQAYTKDRKNKNDIASELSIVSINNFNFEPENLTIKAGTEVRFINNDDIMHTVVSNFFDSGILKPGDNFIYHFNKPGRFQYYCSVHPTMKGIVLVE